jgi:hypothetical protein
MENRHLWCPQWTDSWVAGDLTTPASPTNRRKSFTQKPPPPTVQPRHDHGRTSETSGPQPAHQGPTYLNQHLHMQPESPKTSQDSQRGGSRSAVARPTPQISRLGSTRTSTVVTATAERREPAPTTFRDGADVPCRPKAVPQADAPAPRVTDRPTPPTHTIVSATRDRRGSRRRLSPPQPGHPL